VKALPQPEASLLPAKGSRSTTRPAVARSVTVLARWAAARKPKRPAPKASAGSSGPILVSKNKSHSGKAVTRGAVPSKLGRTQSSKPREIDLGVLGLSAFALSSSS